MKKYCYYNQKIRQDYILDETDSSVPIFFNVLSILSKLNVDLNLI